MRLTYNKDKEQICIKSNNGYNQVMFSPEQFEAFKNQVNDLYKIVQADFIEKHVPNYEELDPPFNFDLDRMKERCEAPSREIPANLTFEEYQEWMMCNEMIENIHTSPAFTIEGAREAFKDAVISPNVSMNCRGSSVEELLEAYKHIVVDSTITWEE